MKQLLLTFTLLSIFTLKGFEYNPIQLAIVNRDPDGLVKLLESTKLTLVEKVKYLDFAEQIILDRFMPPALRTFRPIATQTDFVIMYINLAVLAASIIYPFTLDWSQKQSNAKFAASMACSFGSLIFLLAHNLQIQRQSNENSIKIKQILLEA